MLRIKLLGSYISKNGNRVFRYGVSGNAAELKEYKKTQGTFYREDSTTGTPLFFTPRFAGQETNLIITQSGKCVADMSAFDAAASLSEQYGGNFGQEIASSMAANLLGIGTPAPTSAPVAEESEVDLESH